MSTPTLFNGRDLTDHLGLSREIKPAVAALREKVVWGWLKGPLKLTARPVPVPEQIFAWALELGGILHQNPAAFSGRQLGDDNTSFSLARRAEILQEAAGYPDGDSDGIPSPRGRFPAARPYPDPACPPLGGRYYTT